MNCIDAIEGTVKFIIDRLFDTYLQERLDDTEYIRNIKSVILGAETFIAQNRELMSEPETIRQVLYTHAKDIWLKHTVQRIPEAEKNAESDDYYAYYFDHLYHHGNYPR